MKLSGRKGYHKQYIERRKTEGKCGDSGRFCWSLHSPEIGEDEKGIFILHTIIVAVTIDVTARNQQFTPASVFGHFVLLLCRPSP